MCCIAILDLAGAAPLRGGLHRQPHQEHSSLNVDTGYGYVPSKAIEPPPEFRVCVWVPLWLPFDLRLERGALEQQNINELTDPGVNLAW